MSRLDQCGQRVPGRGGGLQDDPYTTMKEALSLAACELGDGRSAERSRRSLDVVLIVPHVLLTLSVV